MSEMILSVIPIFLLILVGYLIKHKFIKNDLFWSQAEALTYYFLFPSLLIVKLSKADLILSEMSLALVVTIGSTLIIALLCFVLKRALKIENAIFTSIFQGSTRYNSYVFLGMSAAFFGERGIALCGIFIAYMIIVTNILSILVLNYYSDNYKKKLTDVGLKILTNPLIIGSVLGLFVNISRISLPHFFEEFLKMVGAASSPLSLLSVGAGLIFSKNYKQINAVVISLFLKLLALPLASMMMISVFNLKGNVASMALLYACLPCAGNSYILARQMGGDTEAMASIITFSTLASGVITPMLLYSFI